MPAPLQYHSIQRLFHPLLTPIRDTISSFISQQARPRHLRSVLRERAYRLLGLIEARARLRAANTLQPHV